MVVHPQLCKYCSYASMSSSLCRRLATILLCVLPGRPVTDMRDVPPAVLKWRVQWSDLLAMEPRIGGSGPAGRQPAGPDSLVVHRKGRPGMDGEPALSEQLRTYSTVPQVRREPFCSRFHFQMRFIYTTRYIMCLSTCYSIC
jgi:hypothetical protein